MSQPRTVLVVDDDPSLRDVVRVALELDGFTVLEARDGKEGLATALARSPAAIVLDINMPELDGLSMCRQLRQVSAVPVIFLSSRDDELDRVLGLELGGDDYVPKPFSPRELVARVRAVLRRSELAVARAQAPAAAPAGARSLTRGRLSLDEDAWQVRWSGQPVVLTVMEFGLLRALAQTPTKVFSREELIDRAYDGVVVSERTVDSHLRRVRQKFAKVGHPDVVETVHGVGYRLGPV